MLEKVLGNGSQLSACTDMIKSRFGRLREIYYRLAADKCGDPAYPRISLTTLVELLAHFGSGSLKTVIKVPEDHITHKKATAKELKLNKKQTVNNKADFIPVEQEDLSLAALLSTELKTSFYSVFGSD